ncbi:MAG: ABC transporter permease [Anaerolineales bacterium]
MRSSYKLLLVETKLFLREPEAFFFTLAFPLIVLFVFGGIFGNEPSDIYGGYGQVDASVPAYVAMVIATVALMGIPVRLATLREQGILRRLRATPLRPAAILTTQLVVNFGMILLGSIFLVIAGKVFYDLRFGGGVEKAVSVLAAFTLSAASFMAVGFLIASLAPTARVAQAIGMVLFFPMLFLSGATIPLEEMPESVVRLSEMLPLTHVVGLLQGLWRDEAWSDHGLTLAMLTGMLVIGGIMSARTFQWEAKGDTTMITRFSDTRWGRVLLAGIGVTALNTCLIFFVIGGYAMSLAIQAQGAPDQAQISRFADQVGAWIAPVLAALLTVGAAAGVARKTRTSPGLHGLLVGLVVAIGSLIVSLVFGEALNLQALAAFTLTVAAGGVGGALGRRAKAS